MLGARVLNNAGSGSDVAVIRGIQWCADNGAHAINVSLGAVIYRGESDYTTSVQAYTAAVDYARARGAVVVIAFPDLEAAHAWYASSAYQAILPLRLRNSTGGAVVVDGAPDDYRAADYAAQLLPL